MATWLGAAAGLVEAALRSERANNARAGRAKAVVVGPKFGATVVPRASEMKSVWELQAATCSYFRSFKEDCFGKVQATGPTEKRAEASSQNRVIAAERRNQTLGLNQR